MEEGWERERPSRVELSLDELQSLVEPAFPGAAISEHAVLGTGLANTNIRFRLHRDAGGELPSEWLRLSRLVDLISQVTFLSDPRDLPRVLAETTGVVEETVRMLT